MVLARRVSSDLPLATAQFEQLFAYQAFTLGYR